MKRLHALLFEDLLEAGDELGVPVQDQVVGILVDSVAEVVDLRVSEIESAPNVGTEESAKFIQGVASQEGELLIIIDLNRLLTDEQWQEMTML